MSKKEERTPTVPEMLDIFRLFKEKADKLRSSSFVKQLPNQEWSYHLDNTTDEFSIVDIRPEDESRDSLILTLRFFVHGEVKLEDVVALYKNLPISEDVKYSVAKSFATFKKALAGDSPIVADGTTYGSDRIFKILMFGQYAHATKGYRKLLERLRRSHEITQMMLNQEFDRLLALHLQYIFWLYNKNAMAIQALEAQSAA